MHKTRFLVFSRYSQAAMIKCKSKVVSMIQGQQYRIPYNRQSMRSKQGCDDGSIDCIRHPLCKEPARG